MSRRFALVAVAFLLPLAGCVGGSGEEANPGTGTTTTPSTNGTTTPPTNGGASGFDVVDLQIQPADGRKGTLREDDMILVTWSLRNDGGARASHFMSLLVNGEVRDVQTVTLEPGGARSFEKRFPPWSGEDDLSVEVRAGARKATTSARIDEWPRTGEPVDIGPAVVTVQRWLKNTTSGGTDVNVTVQRKAAPDGNYSMLRAHALCATQDGNVTTHGEARPEAPDPGDVSMTDIRLPGCPDTIYGVDLTGQDAQGEDIYVRILFVERGWRPPILPS